MTDTPIVQSRKAVTGLGPHPDAVYALGPPAPVEVCQLEAEFARVLDLYVRRQPGRVLEIGTASGGTLYHWLTNAQPGATVVTVDLPESDYESFAHLYAGWVPDGVTLAAIAGDSHEAATVDAVREHGPFDWLFIDGAHTYADAVQDWDDYRALCSPGAVVVFHDISLIRKYEDGTEAGVWKLWRELQAQGYTTCEFRAQPLVHAYGLGALMLP